MSNNQPLSHRASAASLRFYPETNDSQSLKNAFQNWVVGVHTYDASMEEEVGTGRSLWTPGQHGLQSDFGDTRGYIVRPCLKQNCNKYTCLSTETGEYLHRRPKVDIVTHLLICCYVFKKKELETCCNFLVQCVWSMPEALASVPSISEAGWVWCCRGDMGVTMWTQVEVTMGVVMQSGGQFVPW